MESVPEMREPLRVTTAPSSLKRSGHPSTPVLDDEQVQGQSKRVRLDTDLHDSRDAAALSDDDNRWRPATSEQQPHASTSSPSRCGPNADKATTLVRRAQSRSGRAGSLSGHCSAEALRPARQLAGQGCRCVTP